MTRPYPNDKDTDVYAIVSVNMDAADPSGADVSVKLVQGKNGADRELSIAYAKLVADNAYYSRISSLNVERGEGSLSDWENGVGVVRCIKVNVSLEDTKSDWWRRFELIETKKTETKQ